jgi:hypothetical protein
MDHSHIRLWWLALRTAQTQNNGSETRAVVGTAEELSRVAGVYPIFTSATEKRRKHDPRCALAVEYGGGGDEETRTPDPLLAKEMLFQLSYVPLPALAPTERLMVGVSGLEPETSALSGQCSNQLS